MNDRQFEYLLETISWATYALGKAFLGSPDGFSHGIRAIDAIAVDYASGEESPAKASLLDVAEGEVEG